VKLGIYVADEHQGTSSTKHKTEKDGFGKYSTGEYLSTHLLLPDLTTDH
jgi:hypothetical protein